MDIGNQRHSLNPDVVDFGDDSIAANEMTLKISQI